MSKVNKHELLKTVGLAAGILILLFIVCLAISLGSVASIRSTEPYKHSVDLALSSPEVRLALGEPVTVGWFTQGSVNEAIGGDAELYIPLQGTNASATIRVNGTNKDGTWKYYAIRVDTDRGERINLLEP